jgi:hypothetical protein
MPDLEEHVEGPLRRGLRQARDAGHLRDIEQVLEVCASSTMIESTPSSSKVSPSSFFSLAASSLSLDFQLLLRPFQCLDDAGVALLALLLDGQCQFAQLVP